MEKVEMTSLPERRPGLFPNRGDGPTDRAIDRINDNAGLQRRADQLKIQREAARLRGAMRAVAEISLYEEALCQLAPQAEGRLRHIADTGTINIARIATEEDL
jgi:hypothetical protein